MGWRVFEDRRERSMQKMSASSEGTMQLSNSKIKSYPCEGEVIPTSHQGNYKAHCWKTFRDRALLEIAFRPIVALYGA